MEKYPKVPMTPKEIWQLIEKEGLKEIRYWLFVFIQKEKFKTLIWFMLSFCNFWHFY